MGSANLVIIISSCQNLSKPKGSDSIEMQKYATLFSYTCQFALGAKNMATRKADRTRRADRTVSWNSDSVFRHPTYMLLLTGEKVEDAIAFPPYGLYNWGQVQIK